MPKRDPAKVANTFDKCESHFGKPNIYCIFDYSTTKKLAKITENRHFSMDNLSL